MQNKQMKQHVKMFKAGKLWLTAGVMALSLGAAGVAVDNNASAAIEPNQTVDAAGKLQDGQYTMQYQIMQSGSQTNTSEFQEFFDPNATATVKGDQVTITLTPISGNNSSANFMMSSMMDSLTMNGVATQKSGNSYSATLPKSALNQPITVQVSLPLMGSDGGDLYVAKMTLNAPAGQTNQQSSTTTDSTKTSTTPTSTTGDSTKTSTTQTSTTSDSTKTSTTTTSTTDKKSEASNDKDAVPAYNVNFTVNRKGSSDPSVMNNMLQKPAKAVYSKDGKQVTLAFEFGGSSSMGGADALSGMLKSWTFNGVEATRQGNTWFVTLPTEEVQKGKTIPMKVVYFQTEEADLVIGDIVKSSEKAVPNTNSTTDSTSSTTDSTSSATNGAKAGDGTSSATLSDGNGMQLTPVANKLAGQSNGVQLGNSTSALPKTAQQVAMENEAGIFGLAAASVVATFGALTYKRKH